MGRVYLAEDKRLGRKVALKILPGWFTSDPERARRFEQEARTASSLTHLNIITIHEIDRAQTPEGELYFIATELGEGETLRSHMSGTAKVVFRPLTKLGSSTATSNPKTVIAAAKVRLGKNDQALDTLAKAVEEKDPGVIELKAEPVFDPLRSDTKFTALLRRIGLTQ